MKVKAKAPAGGTIHAKVQRLDLEAESDEDRELLRALVSVFLAGSTTRREFRAVVGAFDLRHRGGVPIDEFVATLDPSARVAGTEFKA